MRMAWRVVVVFLLGTTAYCGAPEMLNYQGRVIADGVNFTGTGQFKFALVDKGTTVSRQATATATVVGGFVVGITVTDGGAGYVSAPAVTLQDATGSGAVATAQVADGAVTAVTVNQAGSGYSATPAVTLGTPPLTLDYVTYWSHDGTSVAGGPPASGIDIPVDKGLYSVLLGDTTLVNMTQTVPSSVFTNSDVRLRVWFNDGVNGLQRLDPDQRLASVGYALMAGSVDGLQETLAGKADAGHAHSAGEITTGTLNAERIPALDAAKIESGTLHTNRIPSLDAAKIGTGAFDEARIPPVYWRMGGNADITANTHFLGTTDNTALELRANNQGALRIEPDAASPRIVAGYSGNIASGYGATVSGGGADLSWINSGIVNMPMGPFPNRATNDCATIGGGAANSAGGSYSVIGGGMGNRATGASSAIGGGCINETHGNYGTVLGGLRNKGYNDYSVIGGGIYNTAEGSSSTIGGGSNNRVTGDYATVPGGQYNTATNYAFAAGRQAKAIHKGAFVWADSVNVDFASTATNQFAIRAGGGVRISAPFLGTTDNTALELRANNLRVLRIDPDDYSPRICAGNFCNEAWEAGATVGGGGTVSWPNKAYSSFATVSGGYGNAAGYFATVPGGRENYADSYAFAAGRRAKAYHEGAFVWADSTDANFISTATNEFAIRAGGGVRIKAPFLGTTDNTALELRANNQRGLRIEPDATSPRIVAGNPANTVSGFGATVGGGGHATYPNRATNDYATVGGGIYNTAGGNRATVAGGSDNVADGSAATIGGGWGNTAGGIRATIGGGWYNTASGYAAAVGGGYSNIASHSRSTVAGGTDNTASGSRSTVGGGEQNSAGGDYATVPGGRLNTATHYAFAAGRRAKANHDGAFVWGDSADSDIASSANNQATFRAAGGFRIYTKSDLSLGAQLAPNATSWSVLSDRAAKENFEPIDTEAILDALAGISLTAWSYKADPDQRRYIGPVAQDFHAAFGLGCDTSIATLDADGVAFAAIQGLHARNEELRQKNAELEAEVLRMNDEIDAIKRHLGL